MSDIYCIADHVITSLGTDTDEVWTNMLRGKTGVQLHDDPALFTEPFWASLVGTNALEKAYSAAGLPVDHTRFEKMCLLSAHRALNKCKVDPASGDTLFLLSTTKGNIDLLEKGKKDVYPPAKLFMWDSARMITSHFGNPNEPVVICNACISGVLALITAFDYLQKGHYKHAVVIGADIASEFVISGFMSFKSLATGPCKPFDASRDGLNLGEGAGTVILSSDPEMLTDGHKVCLRGGASANDSNHISGPSRDGEGLYLAISKAMEVTGVKSGQIDFISAHGTATPYNDEMESKAFSRAGLNEAPLNSMKGYFGHTLGAAGIIETIIAIQGMKQGMLLKTLGHKDYGVPEKINIISENSKYGIRSCLKTASGFGGCNAALVLSLKS